MRYIYQNRNRVLPKNLHFFLTAGAAGAGVVTGTALAVLVLDDGTVDGVVAGFEVGAATGLTAGFGATASGVVDDGTTFEARAGVGFVVPAGSGAFTTGLGAVDAG